MTSSSLTLAAVNTEASEGHILDNPAWFSLTDRHANFAEVNGKARRYSPTISLFAGLDDLDNGETWRDFAELLSPRGSGVLMRRAIHFPDNWVEIFGGMGVQMVGGGVLGEIDEQAVTLLDRDIPDMIDLVSRTEPGPFEARTIELGNYIGFKEDGKLIAMAGCRLRPTGWREISAVCTDPNYRGRGLAARLVKTLVARIKADGEMPFLHAAAANTGAIRLYESLGFLHRATMQFAVLQPI